MGIKKKKKVGAPSSTPAHLASRQGSSDAIASHKPSSWILIPCEAVREQSPGSCHKGSSDQKSPACFGAAKGWK